METKTITLTVTESEARTIYRALQRSKNHWLDPETKTFTDVVNKMDIAKTFGLLAQKIKAQAEAQGS